MLRQKTTISKVAMATKQGRQGTPPLPTQSDVDGHPPGRGLGKPRQMRKKVELLTGAGESAIHPPYETRTAASAQLWATRRGSGGWWLSAIAATRRTQPLRLCRSAVLRPKLAWGVRCRFPTFEICCQLRCCDRQRQGQNLGKFMRRFTSIDTGAGCEDRARKLLRWLIDGP